jgi:hypothetical protein
MQPKGQTTRPWIVSPSRGSRAPTVRRALGPVRHHRLISNQPAEIEGQRAQRNWLFSLMPRMAYRLRSEWCAPIQTSQSRCLHYCSDARGGRPDCEDWRCERKQRRETSSS